jgi:uncharacterized protein YdeI (YjbR/CyaY-like superfamily)
VQPTFFATAAAFRTWLEKHHEKEPEVLVGFYKKGTGTPSITWPEAVDEALCFGWIDGVRRSLGDEAYSIRFTPRKPRSIWSAVNVARIEELQRLGRLTAAGLQAFEARVPERTAVYSHERQTAAELAPDEDRRLRANREASAFFDRQAPSYRRAAIHWVITAKRTDTRQRRLEQLINDSAEGRTVPPLTRPAGQRR